MADAFGGPDGIRLGQPSYGGTGCPGGTAAATLSPDATSLSILFDAYQVEAGGMTGRQTDRKSCNVAIPVTVPQGYSVSIIQIDYRGFNSLPYGAQSRFNVEYFFAGTQGPAFSRDFFGATNEDFLINNQLRAEAVIWSACGAEPTLRANTSLMVQSNYQGEQALASVDSADVQASVVFQLQWKRCNGGAPTPYPDPYPPTPPAPPAPPVPPSYGDCTMDSVTDYYGRITFRVFDRFGRILGEYGNRWDADSAMRIFENNGMCRGNGGGGGYDPRPNPRPVPRPNPRPIPMPPGGGHRDSFTCTVSTQVGQFRGTGPTADSAAADARSSCIRSVNNSFTCNRAPISCYRR